MTGWVLVTGGARRIGRAIALELATQGFDIILHYNKSADEAAAVAEEIEKLDRQVVLAEIDLSRSELVAKLIPSLTAELGVITGLVNNASVFELDQNDPDGRLNMAVNAEAPRILSQSFYTQIHNKQNGAIINMLDGVPPETALTGYNKSKVELKNITLSMARNFAPRVRVNGIAPGPTLPSSRQSEQHFQTQVDATPLRKKVSPADIARAASFLMTSPAITGEILHVDGGQHLKEAGVT